MKRVIFKFIGALFFFIPFELVAQDAFYQSLNINNELPSNSVYNLLGDSKGFIWFSCDEGLYRYDGIQFKSYRSPKQESYSGSDILEDKTGRIWYQNFDGYTFYVSKNDSLKPFTNIGEATYYSPNATSDFIFILEGKSIVAIDVNSTKRVKTFQIKEFPISSVVFNNEYYFTAGKYIYKITKDLKIKKTIEIPVNRAEFNYLFTDNKSIYFTKKTGEGNGIWKVEDVQTTQIANLPADIIIQKARILENKLCLMTTQGLYQYSKEGKFITTLFKNKNISDAIVDHKKNYWLSSTVEGIMIVPDTKVTVTSFENLFPYKLLAIDDELIITSKNEKIARFNPKNNQITILYEGTNNAIPYYLHLDKSKDEFVFVQSDGFSYFTNFSSHKIKAKVSIAIKKIEKIDEKYTAFAASGIMGFYCNKSDLKKSSSFDQYIKDLNQEVYGDITLFRLPLTSRGKSVYFDKQKSTLYLITNSGFYSWKNGELKELKENGKSVVLSNVFKWQNQLFGFGINGILRTIPFTSKNEHQKFNDLLNQTDLKQVKVQDRKLIVRTRTNIFVYLEQSNKLISSFDISNLECNDFILIKSHLIISTSKGLIKWNIENELSKRKKGLFRLLSIQVGNQQFEPTKKLFLDYQQTNITIDFALLDFGIKSIEHLYYQVNNEDWKLIDPRVRTLNFPALASGDYIIRFKGTVNGKTENFSTITFKIATPFWLRPWFLSSLIVFVLLLALFYYRFQLNVIKTRNNLINDKIKLESNLSKSLLSSIKSQMNPHFIFNALNTIQAYIYLNDKTKATNYLSKFSKLTRSILEMSEKEKITLSDELIALELYLELEKMRFQDEFEFHLNVKVPDHDSIYIPSMLIQPYLENAVKHGLLHSNSHKKLIVDFSLEDSNLIVVIDDNGIGRKRANEINQKRSGQNVGAGFSTKANERRLEILNSIANIGVQIEDKVDEHQQPSGTRVTLTIQVTKKNEKY
jgi:ligand-binding sensor domain-containing protein